MEYQWSQLWYVQKGFPVMLYMYTFILGFLVHLIIFSLLSSIVEVIDNMKSHICGKENQCYKDFSKSTCIFNGITGKTLIDLLSYTKTDFGGRLFTI